MLYLIGIPRLMEIQLKIMRCRNLITQEQRASDYFSGMDDMSDKTYTEDDLEGSNSPRHSPEVQGELDQLRLRTRLVKPTLRIEQVG